MYDPSEALLQLGLYDYVWGNPALLQTYNANVQADKARKEQQAYNSIWKNIELAKLRNEENKRKSIAKSTAEAKVTQLLDGYGYKTPQQRAYIDKQIDLAVLEGELDPRKIALYKQDAIDNANEEMAETAAKNAVLDPIKQEIRLHGLYSSAPTEWKDIKGDAAKAIQTKLGFTGKDLDGILGKKSIAAIERWNNYHPEDQITQPNDLDDILKRIDALEYDFKGEKKKYNPAELDELRKLVYGGDDPTATRRKSWDDFYQDLAKQKARERAEQLKKDKARLAELQKVLDANYKLSATEEAEYNALKAKGL